jgi:hypothetical protein
MSLQNLKEYDLDATVVLNFLRNKEYQALRWYLADMPGRKASAVTARTMQMLSNAGQDTLVSVLVGD